MEGTVSNLGKANNSRNKILPFRTIRKTASILAKLAVKVSKTTVTKGQKRRREKKTGEIYGIQYGSIKIWRKLNLNWVNLHCLNWKINTSVNQNVVRNFFNKVRIPYFWLKPYFWSNLKIRLLKCDISSVGGIVFAQRRQQLAIGNHEMTPLWRLPWPSIYRPFTGEICLVYNGCKCPDIRLSCHEKF